MTIDSRHRTRIASLATAALLLSGTAFGQDDAGGAAETVYVRPGATVYTHPLRQSAEDRALTQQIVERLANDHRLQNQNIGVTVVGGIVRLSGAVSSPVQIYRAVELTRQVPGVRRVYEDIAG
ncbi:MAG: BON domain-containing protein [Solimonas sp.]